MNRTILYYPTIDIPDKAWLRHALMYWDEVASIVPQDYGNKILIDLSTDIQYLMSEGQFRAIRPDDLIIKGNNWDAFQEFQDEFREIVSSSNFRELIGKSYSTRFNIHVDKITPTSFSRIHTNKTSDSIVSFLMDLGLAKRSEDYEWLLFEHTTALLYMSLLAKYLADIDANQTTIGTDIPDYERLNFKKVREDEGFPVVSVSLDKLLPSPKPHVSLEQIIDFKNQRSDNLIHFKKIISDCLSKISKAKSNTELKEITASFTESLSIGVKDLTTVLGDSKIDSTFKTLKSLINLRAPALLTSGAFTGSLYGNTTTGLAIGAGIEITATFIEARNRNRAKLRESPFSYLYKAQQAGLIRKT
ncbi:MAG: DUF6236 family protein [Bacteroidota bacterium]